MSAAHDMRANAPSFPGMYATFRLGIDRFNVHGHEAYRMTYPHKDNPRYWGAYRAGIRAAEFGRSYDEAMKGL